ncbi:MAG: c-type cytochrome [Candidatus Thiodiazotropha sp. (ex Myrtea spinifera)]|nr:c-type cytochrome [Candidatus Thiodiazotropha sp. (ex Myrtea spinifera)]MCU7829650.1 c-type cytochrome [Candidatus Thiodiazotropha sp. (ex Myrtea sp. 'scaly one' KF741663)]
MMRLSSLGAVVLATVMTASCGGGGGDAPGTTTGGGGVTMVELGRKLFFDTDLSNQGNQSCASCHDPATGFADPRVTASAPVSEGSVTGDFGDRNAPTAAYASFSPQFGVVAAADQTPETNSKYQGGQFLDGRAATLIEQAKGPFLNPVEMNNASEAEVVAKVQNAAYSADFLAVFGANAFSDITTAYNNIATAIAAFEASPEMNPFTSKFDAYLAGNYTLTASEQRGKDLFEDASVAKCANCHTIGTTSRESLFTNFRYYNIGTPSNPNNPANIANPGFVDQGLGASAAIDPADQAAEQGKFKTPTLRNVELTAPYMHNGSIATLEDVVKHYDIDVPNLFITPEVNDPNIAAEMNAGTYVVLGLQPQDYTDLVNFMLTLTDGYF